MKGRHMKLSDETWNFILEEKKKSNVEWDIFLKDCVISHINYKREKGALDKKQSALANAVVGAEDVKKRLESVVPEDVIVDRDRWKKRAEEAENKLSDIGNMTMR
jgi:hypothetical protein